MTTCLRMLWVDGHDPGACMQRMGTDRWHEKNAVPKKVWETVKMDSSTSRVRKVATMVEMKKSTTLTAQESAKESNFSDAVCQSSTDSSVSRGVIRESTQNTMSTWKPSG